MRNRRHLVGPCATVVLGQFSTSLCKALTGSCSQQHVRVGGTQETGSYKIIEKKGKETEENTPVQTLRRVVFLFPFFFLLSSYFLLLSLPPAPRFTEITKHKSDTAWAVQHRMRPFSLFSPLWAGLLSLPPLPFSDSNHCFVMAREAQRPSVRIRLPHLSSFLPSFFLLFSTRKLQGDRFASRLRPIGYLIEG